MTYIKTKVMLSSNQIKPFLKLVDEVSAHYGGENGISRAAGFSDSTIKNIRSYGRLSRVNAKKILNAYNRFKGVVS